MASLYTLLLVCMGIATIVEKLQGVGFAKEHIYGTGWFVALWVLLALLSVYYIVKARLHKRMAVLLLHLALLLILMGAFVTHLFPMMAPSVCSKEPVWRAMWTSMGQQPTFRSP